MRKVIAILVIAGLFLGGVACTLGEVVPKLVPKLFDSMVVYGAEMQNSIEIEGNVMAVFYKRDNEQVIGAYSNAIITDRGDGRWDVEGREGSMTGVSQSLMTYGLYQYQKIDKLYDEEGYELPLYLSDLNLQPITWSDLPQSMHAAALKSVAIVDGSPRATVYRMFMGVAYEVPNCRVTQSAYDNYMADTIKLYNPAYHWNAPENKDCFVLVYFISETPYGTEIDILVIVDKVIK